MVYHTITFFSIDNGEAEVTITLAICLKKENNAFKTTILTPTKESDYDVPFQMPNYIVNFL